MLLKHDKVVKRRRQDGAKRTVFDGNQSLDKKPKNTKNTTISRKTESLRTRRAVDAQEDSDVHLESEESEKESEHFFKKNQLVLMKTNISYGETLEGEAYVKYKSFKKGKISLKIQSVLHKNFKTASQPRGGLRLVESQTGAKVPKKSFSQRIWVKMGRILPLGEVVKSMRRKKPDLKIKQAKLEGGVLSSNNAPGKKQVNHNSIFPVNQVRNKTIRDEVKKGAEVVSKNSVGLEGESSNRSLFPGQRQGLGSQEIMKMTMAGFKGKDKLKEGQNVDVIHEKEFLLSMKSMEPRNHGLSPKKSNSGNGDHLDESQRQGTLGSNNNNHMSGAKVLSLMDESHDSFMDLDEEYQSLWRVDDYSIGRGSNRSQRKRGRAHKTENMLKNSKKHNTENFSDSDDIDNPEDHQSGRSVLGPRANRSSSSDSDSSDYSVNNEHKDYRVEREIPKVTKPARLKDEDYVKLSFRVRLKDKIFEPTYIKNLDSNFSYDIQEARQRIRSRILRKRSSKSLPYGKKDLGKRKESREGQLTIKKSLGLVGNKSGLDGAESSLGAQDEDQRGPGVPRFCQVINRVQVIDSLTNCSFEKIFELEDRIGSNKPFKRPFSPVKGSWGGQTGNNSKIKVGNNPGGSGFSSQTQVSNQIVSGTKGQAEATERVNKPKSVILFEHKVRFKRCCGIVFRTYELELDIDSNKIPSFQKGLNLLISYNDQISNFFNFLDYELIETTSIDKKYPEEYILFADSVLLDAEDLKKTAMANSKDKVSMVHKINLAGFDRTQHVSINLGCMKVQHRIKFYLSESVLKKNRFIGEFELFLIRKKTMLEKQDLEGVLELFDPVRFVAGAGNFEMKELKA